MKLSKIDGAVALIMALDRAIRNENKCSVLINRRVITVHGGHEICVLTPIEVDPNIAAGHDNKGFHIIWGNGTGFNFLTESFLLAAELKKDELLYIPTRFLENNIFTEIFQNYSCKYSLICTNYCELKISPKDIDKLLKVKVYSEQIINRWATIEPNYIDRWETKNRLTIKIHKKNMYISTNRDGFCSLAAGTKEMAENGDEQYDYLCHRHYDSEENTSASVGVTLYHWPNR